MAPRERSRRAARAAPAPEPAEEVGQGAPAGRAPQAVESLSRLNRNYHIAGALNGSSGTLQESRTSSACSRTRRGSRPRRTGWGSPTGCREFVAAQPQLPHRRRP
ncbi:hypothetical protein PIB30_055482, partial [Stylosanthes scabra]|nr:hypothetical protein [Stylosanthes scabra]